MGFEIRKDKQTRGAKLRREREEYFRLVDLGYSNKEASKLVGINIRTGREWRNGRPEGRKSARGHLRTSCGWPRALLRVF
ncbi:hypothetical protein OHA99_22045 [Streptomyces coelicoflavus]